MLRAVKGQRARPEKELEVRQRATKASILKAKILRKTQSQFQHAPVGLSLKRKRMEATRQREEKRRRCGGGGWREREM
jgi:hypothetical protein